MREERVAQVDRLFEELELVTREDASSVVHHGPRLERSDRRAAELVGRGGSLDWVTLSWPPIDMWDLHVGVLVAEEVSVGVHVRAGADGRLAAVAERVGGSWGERRVSEPAQETQWNRTVTAERAAQEAKELGALVRAALRAESLIGDAATDR